MTTEESYDGVIGVVFRRIDLIRFLLIQNKTTGNITFPAGGREEWEHDSIDTLYREIQEETGLTPSDYSVIATPLIHSFVYGPKKKERAGQHARQPVYLCETNKTELHPKDPDSSIYWRYSLRDAQSHLSFSDAKELLIRVQDYM